MPDLVAAPLGMQALISMSGARAAYIGPSLNLSPHRNAVATIALALENPFDLDVHSGGGLASRRATIALIPPGTTHHLRTTGLIAFLYLDALSDDHIALARVGWGAETHLPFADSDPLAVRAMGVDGICANLGVPSRFGVDDRIASVTRRLDHSPQEFIRVADAANGANLSSSRFQALFREATGVPFRRYRLWRRMAVVMRAIACGVPLTVAAHAAGFSSSAHLSSTFRAMFGLCPSDLVTLGAEVRVSDEQSIGATHRTDASEAS